MNSGCPGSQKNSGFHWHKIEILVRGLGPNREKHDNFTKAIVFFNRRESIYDALSGKPVNIKWNGKVSRWGFNVKFGGKFRTEIVFGNH